MKINFYVNKFTKYTHNEINFPHKKVSIDYDYLYLFYEYSLIKTLNIFVAISNTC